MRSAKTIYKEIVKGGQLAEDTARRPRTLFDTKKLTAQAQLVGILKALAWVVGELKESPVR